VHLRIAGALRALSQFIVTGFDGLTMHSRTDRIDQNLRHGQ
jgi:hypothetical protein